MERELHFRCWKDVGLAREIAAARGKGTGRFWGNRPQKDSDLRMAVISPRSVYGIGAAVIGPLAATAIVYRASWFANW
jgi:hypothetical protein